MWPEKERSFRRANRKRAELAPSLAAKSSLGYLLLFWARFLPFSLVDRGIQPMALISFAGRSQEVRNAKCDHVANEELEETRLVKPHLTTHTGGDEVFKKSCSRCRSLSLPSFNMPSLSSRQHDAPEISKQPKRPRTHCTCTRSTSYLTLI